MSWSHILEAFGVAAGVGFILFLPELIRGYHQGRTGDQKYMDDLAARNRRGVR